MDWGAALSLEPALVHPPPLRCLEPGHPADCAVCVAAPEAGEEGECELVGDAGRKNGEKLLRRALTATPEWRSKAARAAAAAGLGPREGRVAAALEAKASSQLRKGDLLLLARTWHYRSTVWRPRGPRSRTVAAPTRAACKCAGACCGRAPPLSPVKAPDGGAAAVAAALQALPGAGARLAPAAAALQRADAALAAALAEPSLSDGARPAWRLLAEAPGPSACAAVAQAIDALCSTCEAAAADGDAAVWLDAAAVAHGARAEVAAAALRPLSRYGPAAVAALAACGMVARIP